MKQINEETFNKYLNSSDEDIKQVASRLLNNMFEYCKVISKMNTIGIYSGDIEVVKSYDTSRRLLHDAVISGIGAINRIARKDNVSLLLNTDNMTREDITDSVAVYCNIQVNDATDEMKMLR